MGCQKNLVSTVLCNLFLDRFTFQFGILGKRKFHPTEYSLTKISSKEKSSEEISTKGIFVEIKIIYFHILFEVDTKIECFVILLLHKAMVVFIYVTPSLENRLVVLLIYKLLFRLNFILHISI